MLSLKEVIQKLYYWQYNNTGCFSDKLFDLFQKADPGNKKRLFAAFPEYAAALELWDQAGDNGDDLFREHGLLIPREVD